MDSARDFDLKMLRARISELAAKGVYLGTSSWKYPGWSGIIYDDTRYEYRGKFAKKRFEASCLEEYAETFKVVGVDSTYYAYPSREFMAGMVSQVPSDFKFGFKVTSDITQKKFPRQPRYGKKAGQENEHFLDAESFKARFLNILEPHRAYVGIIMFEFTRFFPSDFPSMDMFVERLDAFLSQLPTGWAFGIEIRNQTFLEPNYFACLSRHKVTHVFNSWTDMPAVQEQLAMVGTRTSPSLVAARFLVTPGLKYLASMEQFEPFDRIQVVDSETRVAGGRLIREGMESAERQTFLFVNNRLEGNAPMTIKAFLGEAGITI